MTAFAGTARPIIAYDVMATATAYKIELAALRAVMGVESRNSGYDAKRRPAILFEPHVFYRQLKGHQRTMAVNAGLAYSTWGSQPYPSGSDAQYNRLARAIKIDEECAYRSISIGLGQILGENFRAVGCLSAKQMFEQAMESESKQLQQMMEFIKTNNLLDELRRHDWYGFARVYNGPGQPQKYAKWLEREYAKWKRITDKPREELTAQDLQDAGSKTIAAAETGKKVVAAAAVAGPTAGAVLDAATQGLAPVTQAVQTAQQAKSAWDWFAENWQFIAVIGLTIVFLILCFFAWRSFHRVIHERVQNARDGINLRF